MVGRSYAVEELQLVGLGANPWKTTPTSPSSPKAASTLWPIAFTFNWLSAWLSPRVTLLLLMTIPRRRYALSGDQTLYRVKDNAVVWELAGIGSGTPNSRSHLALAVNGNSGTAKIVYVATLTKLTAINTNTKATVWEKTFASPVGTPVIAGVTTLLVIVGGSSLLALDSSTGDELWSRSGGYAGGLYHTRPAVELPAKRVYVGGKAGIACLQLETGANLWFYDSNSDLGSFIAWMLTSPAVGPDSLIVMGSLSGHVVGLNGTTGRKNWAIELPSAVFGSAAM